MSGSNGTRERPIGVFDSGVGGLTVMRAITELLPDEDIVYLGDTARVPYGNRAPETVRRYAKNCADVLVERRIKALVIACNTASAHALDAVRESLAIPVIGVIDPVARTAASTSQTDTIAVIGTRGTVRSNSYPAALERLGSSARVIQRACPLFVPLAEEGWTKGAVPEAVARRYLESLAETDVDTLILGCTHYPLLHDTIAAVVSELTTRNVTLLDSAASTARDLRDRLESVGLCREPQASRSLRFLLTDVPDRFETTAERFFGQRISTFEHVDIIDHNST
ncbi:MAG: glutamate racemase [Persicimonas sp.]